MKTRKIIILLVLAVLFSINFISCKKYEDGPTISLRSKTQRLVNSWQLEKYYLNGVESTSSLLISGYREEYTKGGSYNRSYVDKDGDFFSEIGDWDFDDKKDNIEIKGVSSIELSSQNSTVTNTRNTILKLKENL